MKKALNLSVLAIAFGFFILPALDSGEPIKEFVQFIIEIPAYQYEGVPYKL